MENNNKIITGIGLILVLTSAVFFLGRLSVTNETKTIIKHDIKKVKVCQERLFDGILIIQDLQRILDDHPEAQNIESAIQDRITRFEEDSLDCDSSIVIIK